MNTPPADARRGFSAHILDVGDEKYGDCTLCQFGDTTVLIDGAHSGNINGNARHPSIPDQLGKLLGQEPPFRISLLVITHAHSDHIGCLPTLIQRRIIEPEWALVADPVLGWGRSSDDVDSLPTDTRSQRLLAALREEIRADLDDVALERFLTDAATLEERYTKMLQTLVDRGTKVVRYGVEDPNTLVSAFEELDMEIVGPSEEHLLKCAGAITTIGRDSAMLVTDWMSSAPTADAMREDIEIYRQLVSGLDALDARGVGAAINNQSIVLRFGYAGRNLLFPGDMQFAAPEVDGLDDLMSALRERVVEAGPYDLFRVPHHGSYNAFDKRLFDSLPRTKLFAISTGEGSRSHPNPRVLQLLGANRDDVDWVRTDRNGQVSIEFPSRGRPRVLLTRGDLDDARPNSSDVSSLPPPVTAHTPVLRSTSLPVSAPAEKITTPAQTVATREERPSVADSVEVFARVPHTLTRVTLTIQVEPGTPAISSATTASVDSPRDDIRIGGGRTLPQLLFVTSREGLAANIGRAEAEHVLAAIQRQGHILFDGVARGVDINAAAAMAGSALASHSQLSGVVILGGPDIVPLQKLDVLEAAQRQRLGRTNDPDDFYVWSDDIYGCKDGDGLPEVPVSRIPDGKSADLVLSALQAGSAPHVKRRGGVRNVNRPFADEVFARISGQETLLVSAPATYADQPPPDLEAERIYFMLHGDHVDATRFWGEDTPADVEAVNIANLPQRHGGVVFAGCCWGALSAVSPAVAIPAGTMPGGRTPDESIPLAFLRAGARAFVGCTGAHYSPLEPPFTYYGAPLHQAFWKRFDAGEPPAPALFNAKVDYLAQIPHGLQGLASRAIEQKILRQYTCLGLGW